MPPTLFSQVEHMAKCAGMHLQAGVFEDSPAQKCQTETCMDLHESTKRADLCCWGRGEEEVAKGQPLVRIPLNGQTMCSSVPTHSRCFYVLARNFIFGFQQAIFSERLKKYV